MPKNVLQKSSCGGPLVWYLKVDTDFLHFVWLLTRGSTLFWMLILQTFLVVNGGKMIAREQAGPIGKKSIKH